MDGTEIALAVAAIGIPALLGYQQNQILERANRIAKGDAPMGAESARPVARYWPILTMALLTIAVYVAVIWDYHDRHRPSWNNTELVQVWDKTFTDETVKLDGFEYIDCTFDNVTFDYEGNSPGRITRGAFAKHEPGSPMKVAVKSENPIVNQTLMILYSARPSYGRQQG